MSNSSSVLYWHNFRRAKLSSSLTSFSSSVQTAYSAFLNVDAFSMLAKTPPPPMWTPTHPPLYPPCTLDDSPGDQLDLISSQWRWATKKSVTTISGRGNGEEEGSWKGERVVSVSVRDRVSQDIVPISTNTQGHLSLLMDCSTYISCRRQCVKSTPQK